MKNGEKEAAMKFIAASFFMQPVGRN